MKKLLAANAALLLTILSLEAIKLGFVMPHVEENRRLLQLSNRQTAVKYMQLRKRQEELGKLAPLPLAPCDLQDYELLE